jgi:hypothetical protein
MHLHKIFYALNETYYGYTSYDGNVVLTDGKAYDGDLVNEVWVQ